MSKVQFVATLAALTVPTAAAAHDPTVPYASRGACESASAQLSQDDWDHVMQVAMGYFSTRGEVASFLTRQFACELGDDGRWYIADHRLDVMNSGWFDKRNHN